MPASRRVSLKDREDRDRSVRRALDAFLTPPEAAVTNVTDVADVSDVATYSPHVSYFHIFFDKLPVELL